MYYDNFKDLEDVLKCSGKTHQMVLWSWLSLGLRQEHKDHAGIAHVRTREKKTKKVDVGEEENAWAKEGEHGWMASLK